MSQTHFRARPVKPSLAHRISNAKQWSGTACGIDHYDCTRILRQVTCSACLASAAFSRALAKANGVPR